MNFLIYQNFIHKLIKSVHSWHEKRWLTNDLIFTPNPIQTNSLFSIFILLLQRIPIYLDFWFKKQNQMGNKKQELALQIQHKKQRWFDECLAVTPSPFCLCYLLFLIQETVSLFVSLSSLHSSTTFVFWPNPLFSSTFLGLWEINSHIIFPLSFVPVLISH